jgi:hypothetical protein
MESTEYDSTAATNYVYQGNGIQLPKYVGGYQLGGAFGLRLMFLKKPIWLHRKMMKLCLGIEWIDNTN